MISRRKFLALLPSVLIAGCDGRPATQTPTSTPMATEWGCDRGEVVCESTRASLSEAQREWVKPVRYDSLSPRLQDIADEVVMSGVRECFPPSSDLDEFIDRVEEKQEKQAEEYLSHHTTNRLPRHVDKGHLAIGDDLHSLFIRIQDVVVSG